MSEQPPDQPDPYAVPSEPPTGGPPAPPPPPVAPPPPPVPQQYGYSQQPGYPPGQPPQQQQYGYAAAAMPSSSGRAIAVMVLGIVGIVMVCAYGLGLICAIVALALAPGAKREIRASNGWKTGEGMVKAGVICSWITVGLSAVAIVVIIIAVVAGSMSSSSGY